MFCHPRELASQSSRAGFRTSSKPRGFSIVEAVIASFLLLAAVLMSVSVFDKTLQTEVGNEERVLAALVAESALAEIRDTAQINFAGVRDLYHGRTYTLDSFPGFEVSTTVTSARLAIPCTPLEDAQYDEADVFPEPLGRYLNDSVWKVDVQVRWDNRGRGLVSLTENVVNFRPANNFEVRILDSSGVPIANGVVLNVPRRGDLAFRASAIDDDGNEIPDIQFSWYVEALTGIGSIQRVSRDGKRCLYFNGYRTFSGRVKDAPGACRLVLEATYQGDTVRDKVRVDNAE